MIRKAALTTFWKAFCDFSITSCVLVIILFLTLWWHEYEKDVKWNINVYLFATPALSWLIYREYSTNSCSRTAFGKKVLEGNQEYKYNDKYHKGFRLERRHNFDQSNENNGKSMNDVAGSHSYDILPNGNNTGLPDDILINICSFLHPYDITSFACVNRSSHEFVDGRHFIDSDEKHNISKDNGAKLKGKMAKLEPKSLKIHNASNQLWKLLWYRDYGHVLLAWHVGKKALRRSLEKEEGKMSNSKHNSKDGNREENLSTLLAMRLDDLTDLKFFYFSFTETYLDYILAGQNTSEMCLLGIHGHIFNFTDFAEHHPGLAEPIRMECGKDATQYFEDLPHSSVARKIARRLCIIVDRACLIDDPHKSDGPKKHEVAGISCGLYNVPVPHWSVEESNSRPPQGDGYDVQLGLDRVIPKTSYTAKKRANSLRSVRDLFDREKRTREIVAVAKATKKGYFRSGLFGDRIGNSNEDHTYFDMHSNGRIHLYYDPFIQRWKSWYTRVDFQPVYCEFDWDIS